MELIFLSLVFAIISAFASGIEASIIALNIYDISKLDLSSKKLRKVESIILGKRVLIFFLLFLNTLSNVGFSISTYFAFLRFNLPEWLAAVLSILFITPFLFVFSELIPKLVFRHYKENVILAISWLLYPLSLLNNLLPSSNSNQSFTHVISVIQGELDEEEDREAYEFLTAMLNIEDYTVKELMIPISEVPVLFKDMSIGEVVEYIRDSKYSKILVSDGFKVVMYTNIRDLIYLPKNKKLGEVSRKIERVFYENLPVRELIDGKSSLALDEFGVVVDDTGVPIGVFDMEIFASNILDIILIDKAKGYGKRSFILNGNTSLRYLFNILGMLYENVVEKFPCVSKISTLNGLILELNKSMPKVGDKIEFMGVTFEVLKVGDYSVEEVKVNV